MRAAAASTGVAERLVEGAVRDVPDGSSWDDVHRWLHHLDPARNGWIHVEDASALLDSLRWLRLTSTEAFWGDDATILAAATAALAGALWQVGLPCGVRASGGPDGISISFGTTVPGAPALVRLIGSFLPGTTVDDDGTIAPPARRDADSSRFRAALWGPPPTRPSDPAASVLGRLSRLGHGRWALHALLIPVASDELDERAGALSLLASTIARLAQHQLVVDDLTTATVDNPEATRLLAGVSTERDRVASGVRTGGWAAVTWLEAPSQADLAAAIGAASAAAEPADARARTRPDDPARGWMPIVGELAPPSLLSGAEVGELLRPPTDDRLGMPSRRWVPLHRHPEPLPRRAGAVTLGHTEDGAALEVPLEALTSHALVTGSPGAGKSTAIASLLVQLATHGIPFTVIEPVKQEYRGLPIDGVRVWRPAAPQPGEDWILNPLEVPLGVSVQSHIERFVALLRSTLGLVKPLPFLIEIGAQRVYEARGWDVVEDRAPADGPDGWPTISELIEVCLPLPAEFGYSEEVQANLRAAMVARLGTLTRGPRSRVLDRDGTFPMDQLLTARTVINLDDFGADDARSFFMGLLLVRIREAFGGSSGGRLVHTLVIEEAHRLLADRSAADGDPADSDAGAGAGTHTAGEIANLLAEIRATGEAVVVVDQSPSTLVPAVLANTGTKVALRADARQDQSALAAAMGLADHEAHVLGGSRRHEALVTWEGMDRPIRARLQHRYLDAVAPVGVEPRRPARRLTAPTPEVRATARTLLRTLGAEARAARSRLDVLVTDALGTGGPALVAGAVEDLVGEEIEIIGRARRWSRDARRAATIAVLTGDDAPEHPARSLADGRLPLPSCRSACPSGGCLLGEPAQAEARVVRAEGPGTLVRLAADPEERRRRLARRAIAVVGTDAPPHLHRLAAACVTVHVFDEWADPATVAGLVADHPAAGPETDGRSR